jgi:hypothetical protein
MKGEKIVEPYKILVKFPTRSREKRFKEVFEKLIKYRGDKENTFFLIDTDIDDEVMNNEKMSKYISSFNLGSNLDVIEDYSKNKIHAVNRDLDIYYKPWDIVILMSDDMTPIKEGYDNIIRQAMYDNFPDTDGIVFFPDGFTEMNTLPIIGRKYYDRFDYIYHPDYFSFFCDNHLHIVADLLGKHKRINEILFRHDHPLWTGEGYDKLYEKNQLDWDHDEKVFNNFAKINFELEL